MCWMRRRACAASASLATERATRYATNRLSTGSLRTLAPCHSPGCVTHHSSEWLRGAVLPGLSYPHSGPSPAATASSLVSPLGLPLLFVGQPLTQQVPETRRLHGR